MQNFNESYSISEFRLTLIWLQERIFLTMGRLSMEKITLRDLFDHFTAAEIGGALRQTRLPPGGTKVEMIDRLLS